MIDNQAIIAQIYDISEAQNDLHFDVKSLSEIVDNQDHKMKKVQNLCIVISIFLHVLIGWHLFFIVDWLMG